MLRDLPEFLSRVFKSTWAWAGVVNGMVSFAGRIHDFGVVTPFIRPVFICVAVLCVGRSLLRVYHEQKAEISKLQKHRGEGRDMTQVLVQKLYGEVRYNLENHGDGAEMIQTDAWEAFTPEHLVFLSREIQYTVSEFYRDLRSLRGLLQQLPKVQKLSEMGMHSPSFERRKALSKRIKQNGKELMTLLEGVLQV
jgi:hypothetical protein